MCKIFRDGRLDDTVVIKVGTGSDCDPEALWTAIFMLDPFQHQK